MRAFSFVLSFLMILSMISFPILKVKAAGGIDDFVERCYTVTLDRGSDPDGFADWKGQLTGGKSVGVNIAYGFLFSKEYANKNKSNEDYVKDLYMLFMGRTPDEDGFNDWVGQLNSGKSRVEVFAGFANSQEFYNICDGYGITAGRFVIGYDRNQVNNVNLFVERLYKVCFNRRGDKDGQRDWVEKLLKKEITGSECARSFIFSQEYINLGLSDEEYVKNLYIAFMGREYDEGGYNNWMTGLKNGMTRDEVFAGFANSAEFDTICKGYGINRGAYTAKDKGTYNPDKAVPYTPDTPDTPETPEHTHNFNKKNTDIKYLKSAATCTKAAVYYYSCECGEKDASRTFTSGSALGHIWDAGTVTQEATLTKKGLKTYKCKVCGETKTEDIACLLDGAKAGDIIKYGKYEQDGNIPNGQEDIEWEILSVEDGRVLVISKYALDEKPYNTAYTDVTWETCTLRSWLNNEFYNTAFSDNEKTSIPSVTLANKDNPRYGTAGGNYTIDKVFCLSLEEMEKYFGDYNWYNNEYQYGRNQKLICAPTQYAINNGAYYYDITADDYNNDSNGLKKYGYTSDCIGRRGCFWWLRSPGNNSNLANSVYNIGSAGALCEFDVPTDTVAVRPALYIEY